jgi:putative Mg2+ transporter-C (MgtC) family protein
MSEWIDQYFTLAFIGWTELGVRILLAIFFGLILGWDRDTKDKPIDAKAYMIVCVTTCILALMGQELYAKLHDAGDILSLDLGKIISGVLTGIGFLGAGAILKKGDDEVIGTGTGASIWAAGGLGLTLGFGFYALALTGFIAVALILLTGSAMVSKLESTSKGIAKNSRDDKESE